MAHKIWSATYGKWVEASEERVQELQSNMVQPGMHVPLPPIPTQEDPNALPLPDGIDAGDTVWMTYNDQLSLDRAR